MSAFRIPRSISFLLLHAPFLLVGSAPALAGAPTLSLSCLPSLPKVLEPVAIEVEGADPGTMVRLLWGQPGFSCPAVLAGDCLDISGAKILVSGGADAKGDAQFAYQLPYEAPPDKQMYIQAMSGNSAPFEFSPVCNITTPASFKHDPDHRGDTLVSPGPVDPGWEGTETLTFTDPDTGLLFCSWQWDTTDFAGPIPTSTCMASDGTLCDFAFNVSLDGGQQTGGALSCSVFDLTPADDADGGDHGYGYIADYLGYGEQFMYFQGAPYYQWYAMPYTTATFDRDSGRFDYEFLSLYATYIIYL